MKTSNEILDRNTVVRWLELRAVANEAFTGQLSRDDVQRIRTIWPKILRAAAQMLREDGEGKQL